MGLDKVFWVRFRIGLRLDDAAGKVETMSGANQRGQRLVARGAVERRIGEGADALATGETKRGLDAPLVHQRVGLVPVWLGYSGRVERLPDAPPTKPARGKRTRLGQRETAIVDVSQLGDALDQAGDVGGSIAGPAPFRHLPTEVRRQFRAAGGEAPDVAKRQLAERFRVQRRPWFARSPSLHGHVCATLPQHHAKRPDNDRA